MHSLLEQVRSVAHHARRIVLRAAFARWLCVVLLAIALAGMADYLFRYRELPLRWFSLAAVLAAAIWSWRKYVDPVLAERWSDREIAQWIERSMPELRDQLSSAVAFLQLSPRDARYGSDLLRADVVRKTRAAVAQRNLTDVLDVREARRAIWILLAVTIVLGAIAAGDTDSTLLALRRLGMPWRQEVWPSKHHLAFTSRPTILPYGHDFEVEVTNLVGRLPAEVTMLYWFDGDHEYEARSYRMTFAGGKMTHRLAAVTQSFQYRAMGGDDSRMEWTRLQVVVPPRILKSRITVRPPAYTGRPVETAERRIQALAGSHVEMEIQVDIPVSTAVLCYQSNRTQQRFPAKTGSDGRTCALGEPDSSPWILSTSGTYSWELTDRNGVTVLVYENTDVDVIPDLPPIIDVESPPAEASFTAQALIRIKLEVRDDLAVQRVKFQAGDAVEILGTFKLPSASDSQATAAAKRRTVEHLWDLASVSNRAPGELIRYEVIAEDFLPQESAPASGVVRIITDEEFQRRMNDYQASLLQRLAEALQLQRTVHARTKALLEQLATNERFTSEESSSWLGLEPGQGRIASILSGDQGAIGLLETMLDELQVNRWEVSELTRHLTAIRQELGRLSDSLIPPVQQRLAEADRHLRFDAPDVAAIVRAWAAASAGQEQISVALEALVDQLGQWDRYRNLVQEVRQLLEEHTEAMQELRELPFAGRDIHQLTSEERAVLERVAKRLADQAAQIDRLQSRLMQIEQRLATGNPGAADTLRQALRVLENEPVSGALREAAKSIANNRLGAAARDMEQSQDTLQKLLAALEQRSRQNARQLEQSLATAVAAFAARQETLLKETTNWSKRLENPEAVAAASQELGTLQNALAAEVHDLSRQTPSASSYSLALELAAKPMTLSGERLLESKFDDPTLQSQRQAFEFLKDILASLAQPQASQNTSDSKPDKSDDQAKNSQSPSLADLKLIRLIQLEILRRTTELEGQRELTQGFSESQQAELDSLAGQQRRLAELLIEGDSASKEALPDNRVAPGETGTFPDREQAKKKGDATSDLNPIRNASRKLQLVNWVQNETPPNNPRPTKRSKGESLDRSLLDDIPSVPKEKKESGAAGEDVGQPSNDSALTEVRREMRQIESLLKQRDTTAGTQRLQRHVASELTRLIEALQNQTSDESKAQPPRESDQQGIQPKPAPARPDSQPGSGTGGTRTDTEAISNWARGAWGVLPNRVRQQIQNLGDEQFLPEYEEIIREYYDRLSERGRKTPPVDSPGPK